MIPFYHLKVVTQFYEPEFISTLKDSFLPRCDLITPNIHEAQLLTNTSIEATQRL